VLLSDEAYAVRFLAVMTGVGLGALCAGMAALLLRPPPS
jgi:hypothetical protein